MADQARHQLRLALVTSIWNRYTDLWEQQHINDANPTETTAAESITLGLRHKKAADRLSSHLLG